MKKFLSLLACGTMLAGFAATSHAQVNIDQIKMSTGNGNALTLLTSGLASPETVTFPDPGGAANVILSTTLSGSQTITGTVNFPGTVVFSSTPTLPLTQDHIFVGNGSGDAADAGTLLTVNHTTGDLTSSGFVNAGTKFEIGGNTVVTIPGPTGGFQNIFLGVGAGNNAANFATADANYAIGYGALDSLNIGRDNDAIGFGSLPNTTDGIDNVAIGSLSGNGNITGNHNTFLGRETGVNAGAYNGATAIGYQAVATGSNMMQLGSTALTLVNTSGAVNTSNASGYELSGTTVLSGTTLGSTITASSLTSLGTQAQALNMGSHQINAVSTPTLSTDAATKGYVDGLVGASTATATTGQIAIYTASNTIGGDANLTDASGQLSYTGGAAATNAVSITSGYTGAAADASSLTITNTNTNAGNTNKGISFNVSGGGGNWDLSGTSNWHVASSGNAVFANITANGTVSASSAASNSVELAVTNSGNSGTSKAITATANTAGGTTNVGIGFNVANATSFNYDVEGTSNLWTVTNTGAGSFASMALTTALPIASGGTNSATALSGNSIMVSDGTHIVQGTINSTATKEFLTQTSSGAPAWGTIAAGDVPSGSSSYIQNQSGGAQAASFWINGSGQVSTLTAGSTVTLGNSNGVTNTIGNTGAGLATTTIGQTTAAAGTTHVNIGGGAGTSVVTIGDATGTSTVKLGALTTNGVVQTSGANGTLGVAAVDLTSEVGTSILPAANGGTGVNNSQTITLTGTGNFTFNTAAGSSVTVPASGTLATMTDLGSYLPLAGGTMTGGIAMGSNNISGNGTIGATEFDAGVATTATGKIVLANIAASTNAVAVEAAGNAASGNIYTMPDAGGNANFVLSTSKATGGAGSGQNVTTTATDNTPALDVNSTEATGTTGNTALYLDASAASSGSDVALNINKGALVVSTEGDVANTGTDAVTISGNAIYYKVTSADFATATNTNVTVTITNAKAGQMLYLYNACTNSLAGTIDLVVGTNSGVHLTHTDAFIYDGTSWIELIP